MSDKESCSRIGQRSVIKFLVAEGCKAAEIHRRMSTVYGATCFIKNKHKKANAGVKHKEQTQRRHKEQTQGHQSKEVILHHENARPHTAAQTCRPSAT